MSDIWIQEGARSSRFTTDPADDRIAVWSPDGKQLVFSSNRSGSMDLYRKRADGMSSEELLLHTDVVKFATSWSPDGRTLLYWSDERGGGDIMVLPMTGDRKPFAFLSTDFNEEMATFSPDGRWVAYDSNESGRYEVYLRPFPGPGAAWQVSTGGGREPRWRAAGKELYFLAPDSNLMAAPVTVHDTTIATGTPQALFRTHSTVAPGKQQYDVARDGRFLIVTELESTSAEPIHILLNWKPPAK
jgi:Tol biopolymer transport system component